MRFPFRVETDEEEIRALVKRALKEDLGAGDVTTRATVGADAVGKARLLLKAEGVVAGLPVFETVFRVYDASIKFDLEAREGGSYRAGTTLALIRGKARSILTCERVALNLIQRLSGIATVTRRFAEAVEGTGVTIVDTRKTTPGLRLLEKYAVLAGGGGNHRFDLGQLALIKDNHIRAAGGVREAVDRVHRTDAGVMVEVELGPDARLEDLRDLQVDLVMLDNWPLRRLGRAIETVRSFDARPMIEVSGGVNLRRVKRIASAGPDFISVGYLTHSAQALDISMELLEED
jgi:nicotinate-nucleotide pyrophosphorylase (carboxylating)